MEENQNFSKFLAAHEIKALVKKLADQLNQDYRGQTVVLVGVLKGVHVFIADLVRELNEVDTEVEFVRTTAYGRGIKSCGTIGLLKDIQSDLRNKHVLIVEEIIDSGRTLKFLYERLKAAEPLSVEVATLFDKPEKRLVDVPVKYVGRKVEEKFLVGYGLDMDENGRNLSDLYYVKYPN